jgi:hypothetical protein
MTILKWIVCQRSALKLGGGPLWDCRGSGQHARWALARQRN